MRRRGRGAKYTTSAQLASGCRSRCRGGRIPREARPMELSAILDGKFIFLLRIIGWTSDIEVPLCTNAVRRQPRRRLRVDDVARVAAGLSVASLIPVVLAAGGDGV